MSAAPSCRVHPNKPKPSLPSPLVPCGGLPAPCLSSESGGGPPHLTAAFRRARTVVPGRRGLSICQIIISRRVPSKGIHGNSGVNPVGPARIGRPINVSGSLASPARYFSPSESFHLVRRPSQPCSPGHLCQAIFLAARPTDGPLHQWRLLALHFQRRSRAALLRRGSAGAGPRQHVLPARPGAVLVGDALARPLSVPARAPLLARLGVLAC